MPADSAITERGAQLIDDLPSWLRDAPEARAVQHVFAKEGDRMREAAIDVLSRSAIARASGSGLAFWERILRITPSPGASTAARRAAASAAYAALSGDISGLTWIGRMNGLLGPGWTYTVGTREVQITVSNPSLSLAELEERIREFTPMRVDIILGSDEGFVLDQSQLDQEPFHPE